MTKAVFVISTGRCATQFIANKLKELDQSARVEHEPLGAGYRARYAYRKPARLYGILGRNVRIQAKFFEIENLIAQGQRYIDVGWPTFAWVEYFAERFGDNLEYVHLVRNPFHVSASFLTHGFFVKRNDAMANLNLIQGRDGNVKFSEFWEAYPDFTSFEKCLYHWLELNSYAQEQSERLPGFKGLYRYEDLFTDENGRIGELCETLLGKTVEDLTYDPFDRFNFPLNTEIAWTNEALIEKVVEVASGLGFSMDELDEAKDTTALMENYAAKRVKKNKA